MTIPSTAIIGAVVFGAMSSFSPGAQAWDHPGHMVSAAIAWSEIERARPELIEKIGQVLLSHPDPGPFVVAAGESSGKERFRQMFIECARWPDDARFTIHDRPAWHTARWPLIAKDAPPKAKAAAKARGDAPAGQALEALTLNFAVLSNPEAKPAERATALCWILHLVGDIHQPMHVTDLFSKEFPAGNAAGTTVYVTDPLSKKKGTMPLHMLWDSNTVRSTELEHVDGHTRKFVKKYPRSALAELKAHGKPDAFQEFAKESHKIAVDFAYGYGIETASDPDKDLNPDRLLKNMIKWIVEGVSPVKEAPQVPAKYWKKLQDVAHRRITLAGYRIADLIKSAADRIAAQRKLTRVP